MEREWMNGLEKFIYKMKKYKTILIDPPWDYGKGWGYGAGEYYKLMSLKDLKNLPVGLLADENSHMYMWCPNSLLPQALELMKCWGFEYKTVITWVKNRSIFGYYFKGQSEQLLFGVKGKLPPMNQSQVTIMDGMVRKHSQKPIGQYKIIESVSPAPRIELFAREHREGWDVWGDQIPKDTQNILKTTGLTFSPCEDTFNYRYAENLRIFPNLKHP